MEENTTTITPDIIELNIHHSGFRISDKANGTKKTTLAEMHYGLSLLYKNNPLSEKIKNLVNKNIIDAMGNRKTYLIFYTKSDDEENKKLYNILHKYLVEHEKFININNDTNNNFSQFHFDNPLSPANITTDLATTVSTSADNIVNQFDNINIETENNNENNNENNESVNVEPTPEIIIPTDLDINDTTNNMNKISAKILPRINEILTHLEKIQNYNNTKNEFIYQKMGVELIQSEQFIILYVCWIDIAKNNV